MKKKLTRSEVGALGGKAGTGKVKSRGSLAMRTLAFKRWRKRK